MIWQPWHAQKTMTPKEIGLQPIRMMRLFDYGVAFARIFASYVLG